MSLSTAPRRTSLLGPRLLGGLSLLGALAAASSVSAQGPAGAPQSKASLSASGTTSQPVAAKPAAKPVAAKSTEVKRDPDGIKGISPYWEAINRGDAEFAAQNLEGAAKEYRSAITQDPKNPLGHLRMTELSLKLSDLIQAQEFVDSALRYSGSLPRQQAQAAFLLAKIAERQGKPDEALAAWAKYRALAPASEGPTAAAAPAPAPGTAAPVAATPGPLPIKVHVATADARTLAIEARKKMLADYAPVLERIKKNVEAADDATGSGASSSPVSGSNPSTGSATTGGAAAPH